MFSGLSCGLLCRETSAYCESQALPVYKLRWRQTMKTKTRSCMMNEYIHSMGPLGTVFGNIKYEGMPRRWCYVVPITWIFPEAHGM